MANFDDPRLLFYSILNPITSLTSLKISCSPLLEGGKVTLRPSGGKVTLRPSGGKVNHLIQ